jgi:hypothetical protein
MTKQGQEGGDNSTNYQAAGSIVIQQGISIAEVRQLVLDLFKANFAELSDLAMQTAERRAAELVNRFLDQLRDRAPQALAAVEDPDVQYALIAAQRAYARTGDDDLGDVLVDILVDRLAESQRGLRQVVLTESLDVAPKLTASQFAALSATFIVTHTHDPAVKDLDDLKAFVRRHVVPYVDDLPVHRSSYQHLEYAGCGGISMGTISLENAFAGAYPHLFSKGFTREQLEQSSLRKAEHWSRVDELLVDSPRTEGKLQFESMRPEWVEQATKTLGLPNTHWLSDFIHQHQLADDKIREILVRFDPAIDRLLEIWNGSEIRHLRLTSVGMAIAHANCRRTTGDPIGDLSIWIDE